MTADIRTLSLVSNYRDKAFVNGYQAFLGGE